MTKVLQKDFQTPSTDFPGTPFPLQLIGNVTAIDLTDPTEGGEPTSQVEVGDPFDVRVDWNLNGGATTTTGGFWIVELFSDDIDGQGTFKGSRGPAVAVQLVLAPPPVNYTHTFHLAAPIAGDVGVYQFTVTISHSTDGNPTNLTEMVAFAESTPFRITATPVEGD